MDRERKKGKQKGSNTESEEKVRNPRTPFHMQWVADIIKPFLADNPEMSYSDIRNHLKLYMRDYASTDSLIQDAKQVAKEDLFGSAEMNAHYANGVVSELLVLGHQAELQFSSRKEVNTRIGKLILMEENNRRMKAGDEQLDVNQRNGFVKAWKKDHAIELDAALGIADGPQHRFLTGICFTTGASVHTVRYLQNIIQADAAHMKIGKYTFFSAYGASANGNMSPIAFAILFGNEDATNWITFWNFAKKVS